MICITENKTLKIVNQSMHTNDFIIIICDLKHIAYALNVYEDKPSHCHPMNCHTDNKTVHLKLT